MSASTVTPRVPGYEIERRLGRGAFGAVYLAREQAGAARLVALKVFPSHHRDAYVRETEMLRRIEDLRQVDPDPYIVQSLASGELEDGGAFIAFEYLEAGSLAQMVESSGPLPAERAIASVIDAARGVARLHRDGLYHRDIKPQNLLIGADGRVRLGDFGLAHELDAIASAAGSPAFAAPEMIAGRRNADGRRVDVYGLGAVLNYLLVGNPMLPGRPDVFALERFRVPRPIQAALIYATLLEPAGRCPDAETFITQLETARTLEKEPSTRRKFPRIAPDWPAEAGAPEPATQAPARAPSRDEAARRLAPGDVIAERYLVRSLLGEGGFGFVFRVLDQLRDAEVALKVLRPSLVSNPEEAARFKREAEIALSLLDEGIVRLFDVGLDRARDLRFFTMEIVDGISLRSWFDAQRKQSRIPTVRQAVEVVSQALRALRRAHATMLHCDLKPENLMLTRAGRVKILDFGLARGREKDAVVIRDALGTIEYMAPEQRIDGTVLDERVDIYSAFAVLYELLTGETPTSRSPPPSALRKGIPRALDALIMRGLEPDRDARPRNAVAALEELEASLGARSRRAGLRRIAASAASAIGSLLGWRASGQRAGEAAPISLTIDPVAPTVTSTDLDLTGRVEGGPGVTLLVGGLPCAIEGGRFAAKVHLSPGVNEVQVVARDGAGREASRAVRVSRRTAE